MLPRRQMLNIKKLAGQKLVISTVLALALAGCTPPGPRALLQGKRLLEKGQYPQAVEKLKVATSLMETNAQAWNYLGLAFHHAGQTAEAQRAYQTAVKWDHDLSEAHYNLACLWLEQNQLENAKLELTAFTLRRSNSADAFLKLGGVQLRLREYSGAEKSFREALRVEPQSPEAWTGLGLAQAQRGRPADALQAFQSAVKFKPGYGPALLNHAIIAQQVFRNGPLALEKYREYLALKPTPENADAVRQVVRQLELELNPASRSPAPTPAPVVAPRTPAAPLTTNAPQVTPASRPDTSGPSKTAGAPPAAPAAITQTPLPAAKSSQPTAPTSAPPAALEVVTVAPEPVIKAATDTPPATKSSVTPAEVKPVSAAPTAPAEPPVAKRGFFQRINPMNLFTSDARPATNLTVVPGNSVRYAYKNPPRPTPGSRPDAERAFAQGVQAHQAQRLPEAMQAYRRATQLDPAFFDAYYNLGLAATSANNLPAALAAYELALALRPDSLDSRYNFALVLRQSNYWLDSANELEKVLASYPNEGRAHLALGNLYAQQMRQPDKARNHYLRVLEIDPRNAQASLLRSWLAENPK